MAGPGDGRPRVGSRWAPLFLFVAALALALFFAGMYVQQIQAWPAVALADAVKTMRVLAETQGLARPPASAEELGQAFDSAAARPAEDAPEPDAAAQLHQAVYGFYRPSDVPRAQVAAAWRIR